MLTDGNAKENSKSTIHSLGTRPKKCETDRKKIEKKFDMCEHVMKKVRGKQKHRQVSMLANASI